MKIILSFIFIVCSLYGYSQKTFDELLESGNKYYGENNFPLAISAFTQAIKKEPKNINGYRYRGQMYFLSGKYDEAIKDFATVISIRDTLYQAYHYLAIAYLYKGDTLNWLEYENKTLKINPNYFDALQTKASYLFAHKKYQEAIGLIDQCLKIQPDNPETNYYKGFYSFEKENFDDALVYFEKSYDQGYNNDLLYNGLAICYMHKNMLSTALLRINTAININPNVMGYYLNRALIYANMNFKELAIKDFEYVLNQKVVLNEEQKNIYLKLIN